MSEEILSVLNYKFNWQIRHHSVPKLLPAGTKIVAIDAFDRSSQNLASPESALPIEWGRKAGMKLSSATSFESISKT